MADISGSIQYVLQNEGGFTVDDGGPTNYGIVEADLAAFRGVPLSSITEDDIRNLTVVEATAIYAKEYWGPMLLDQVENQSIATCIFDTGVNRGIRIGAEYAQEVCESLGYQLNIDGHIGPITLTAINACAQASFINAYYARVMEGYEEIVQGNPGKYSVYMPGWTNRAKRLLTLAA